MTRRARRRRARIAAGIVAFAASLGAAFAAIDMDGWLLVPDPPVVVITTLPGSNASGSEALRNEGSNPAFVNALDVAPSPCADFTVAPISPDAIPMTVAGGAALDLNVTCNAPSVNGTIRSCQYSAKATDGTTIGRFRALCNVYGSASLISTVGSVDLGTWPVGTTGSPVTASWASSTDTLSAVSIWAADNNDVFKILAPCAPAPGVTGCTDLARAVAPNITQPLTMTCRPIELGPVSTTVYLTGNTGAHGQLTVTCNGVMGGFPNLSTMMDPITHATTVGVPVSTQITVTNSGTVTADVTGITGVTPPWSASFSGCPGGMCLLGAGSAFVVTATYLPTAPGTHNITPTINSVGSGSLTLEWNGTANAALPGSISVDPTLITRSYTGTPIADTVTITNVGGGPLQLNGYAMTGTGWTTPVWPGTCPLGMCTLAMGGSVQFQVTLLPTIPGEPDAEITLFSDDSDVGPVTVTLDGDLVQAQISVTPLTHDAAAVVGMAAPPQAFDVHNPGLIPLALTGATETGASDWFVMWDGVCPAGTCVLQPNATVQFSATYLPTTAGTHTKTVRINSNAMSGHVDVELNGNATASTLGQLRVSTNTVYLEGDVNVPHTSAITIENIGDGPLEIYGHTLDVGVPQWTAQWAECASGCVMDPDDVISIDLQFLSPVIANSVISHLRISSDDNGVASTETIDLEGKALGSTIDLTTNLGGVPTVNFGQLPATTTSTEVTFELTNTGNRDTPAFDLVVPSAYTVSPSQLTLQPSIPQVVTISCTPPTVASFDGTLTLANTAGVTSTSPNPFAITLRCTGTDSQLVVAPQPIMLGEIRVGNEVRRQVTLATIGDPLTVTARSLSGANSQLSLGSLDTPNITLGAPASFDVIATATADDNLADTLTVTAGTTQMVEITGTVVTPDIDYLQAIDLGTFCVGRTPAPQTVGFRASASASILMTAAPALQTGTAFELEHLTPMTPAYPYRLASGATATVRVAPLASNSAGGVTDAIVWQSDMPLAESVTTNLTATFISAGGAIAPTSVSFKNTVVKQRSEHATITLENCDATALALQPPSIDNPAFVDISATPLPAMLQPTEQATIDVLFEPKRAGATTGTLLVASSAGQLAVVLDGLGLGTGDDTTEKTGFYACSCSSGDPAATAPIVLALAGILRRRRRR